MKGEQMKEAMAKVLEGLGNTQQIRQGALVKEYLPKIEEIAADVKKTLGDGFQWQDVVLIFRCVRPLMTIAKEIDGLSGEQKKEFVKEAIWLVYKTYDGGKSGNENNIDIPLLFGAFERKVEETVIPMMAEVAVEALYPVLKEKGEL